VPEDVPEVFGSLLAVIPVAKATDVQTRFRALGSTRCTNADTRNLDTQPGARAVDVGVERRWSGLRAWGRLTATLQVENVGDAAIYDKCGLPQAGRTLRLGIRLG
jgi:hypothetical protein